MGQSIVAVERRCERCQMDQSYLVMKTIRGGESVLDQEQQGANLDTEPVLLVELPSYSGFARFSEFDCAARQSVERLLQIALHEKPPVP
jgi:hypothetical protein